MIIKYIQTAMHQATYELLEDGIFYGEITECKGFYANAETLEACRYLLQEVVEGWIILGFRLQHQLLVIENI